jgi:hypothetical protein
MIELGLLGLLVLILVFCITLLRREGADSGKPIDADPSIGDAARNKTIEAPSATQA